LLEIRNKEGETVPVNQVVAIIGEAGEAGEQPAAASKEPEPPPPLPTAAAPVESTEEVKQVETAREPAAAGPEGEPKVASPEPAPAPPADQAGASEEERLKKFSSPLVRSMAAKEGVNLEEVKGTGAQGRVTKDDLVAYLDQ